ncbi:STAS domain-containing protein [Streptomyces sp. 900116325]
MDPLTVSSDRRDGWSVVEVAGELDLATADHLGNRLADVITAHSPARIVLDMSKVDFCDASGLRVLVHAHHTARQHHGLLHLVCPKGKVRRLLRVAGLAEVIPAHATPPDALTPAPREGGKGAACRGDVVTTRRSPGRPLSFPGPGSSLTIPAAPSDARSPTPQARDSR